MKRLLCIVGSMDAGGAETFLMKLYRKLDKSRFQIDFAVAKNEPGYYDQEILSLGGRLHHIHSKSSSIIQNFKDIKNLVSQEKYAYVLRTSQHSLSALELLAAKWGGAKITAFRSSNSNTTSGTYKELFLHRLFRFMPRHFANVRIAPSTEAAEFMFGKGCIRKNQAVLLHNAVDFNLFCYNKDIRNTIRNEFKISNSTTVIGNVGRFNQQKNHGFLLDVFLLYTHKNPNAVLLLVGKGELQTVIEEKVRKMGLTNKVLFVGVRSDIPALLSAMDVFVFPSLYEGMPNTVIEAQATGLQCVISNTITREANITGLIHYLPLGNASEWANYIERLPKVVRETPRQKFKENCYDIETVTKQFVKLIFRE